MRVIYTDKSKCKKCYSCVRSCPVKAIKVQDDGIVISRARCINCGDCLDACSQGAIQMTETINQMEAVLSGPHPTVMLLDRNWPITFPRISPLDLESILLSHGFSEVRSSMLAIEHVFQAYENILKKKHHPFIGSLCPISSAYIEKHAPSLIPFMVPVTIPGVATARYLNKRAESPFNIVLATSCLGTKALMEKQGFKEDIEVVVTFRELKDWLIAKGSDLKTDGSFDYRSPLLAGSQYWLTRDFLARLIPGGESKRSRILAVSGAARTLAFLKEVHDGSFRHGLSMVKYCTIDNNSHGVGTDLTLFQRQDLQARVIEEAVDVPLPVPDGERLDLSRPYVDRSTELEETTPEAIQQILDTLGMNTRAEELNCGACGFPTCREKAKAVVHGFAKLEMCLPYLIRELSTNNEELTQKYEIIHKQFKNATTSPNIIGTSKQIQQVLQVINQVAPTPTTVLIRGESGTGKELVARAIHRNSDKAGHPLIAINCTAIAEGVLDSELFGHAKGAFTGAIADKKGLFEEADGGTLFLDEIGDISMELQAKLLRVVDTGEIRRVGENSTRKVDVRLIAATNRNLEKAIESHSFREDLFYRLAIITVRLPPLRDRQEDIPLLAKHLLQKACARVNKQVHGISDDAMEIIMAYHWPGNIRELENVIERAVVLAPLAGSLVLIEPKHLPAELQAQSSRKGFAGPEPVLDYWTMRDKSIGSAEKKLLVHYLKTADGNVTKACAMAGIPRRTFYRMMERQGIRAREVAGDLHRR
ncbi:MAG TPA: AAA family ATPase [Proteobacteria bacterium]|nr:transcriptional regulatory protein ZraR [bacterium BMS3Abin14]HDL53847.1 AAA family ATPase [Pseudomonadota bacterium]